MLGFVLSGRSRGGTLGPTIILLCLVLLVGTNVSGVGSARSSHHVASTSTGLSKMKLGLNSPPGAAQNVSLTAGVQYYRIGISFSTTTIRAVNTEARTVGVDYLGILDSTTLGVVRGGAAFHKSCITNCNWTLADWNAVVKTALADYPTIHHWEIWNEPYSSTQRSGYLTNASTYYTMVKNAYKEIKAHDKNDTVVCLGGSGIAISAALTFAKTFWSYGAASYCSAISLHGYISGTTLFNTSAYERAEWPKNLKQFENLTNKPIWITEFGRESAEAASTTHYSQSNQKFFLDQSMAIFENLSFVKRAYLFNLAGLSNPPAYTDFGVLNATTLKPKIAWPDFLSMYAASASHQKVALVTQSAPTLHVAHWTIVKGLLDKINATVPYPADPIQILVNGVVKASGNGSTTYNFVGGVIKSYTIIAFDKFTGLKTTRTIKVV